MAMRYWKKLEPRTNPVLANGSPVKFTTLDQITGYFAIDNDTVNDGLAQMVTEGRFGLTEIPAQEFVTNYIEKKKALSGTPLKPLWREEIGSSKMPEGNQLMRALNANPAAVDVSSRTAVTAAEAADAPKVEASKQEFNPPKGRRIKPRSQVE